MQLSVIDWIILAPLVPAAPFALLWWLPWSQFPIMDRIPKLFLGPYYVYFAFALWHFKMDWWGVLTLLFLGLLFTFIGLREKWKREGSYNPSGD